MIKENCYSVVIPVNVSVLPGVMSIKADLQSHTALPARYARPEGTREMIDIIGGVPPITKRGTSVMETQDIFLTNDGLQHAVNQLEFLRTVKRAEIAQYLHDAKESGDVIDNAAYEEAKNLHAHLEG